MSRGICQPGSRMRLPIIRAPGGDDTLRSGSSGARPGRSVMVGNSVPGITWVRSRSASSLISSASPIVMAPGWHPTPSGRRAILGPMEQRISMVTLGVADLARARAFYEALGWSGAQQPDDEVAFYQAGGMIFGLWAALGGHGAPGVELAHNVRSPEEVDALLAAAKRA